MTRGTLPSQDAVSPIGRPTASMMEAITAILDFMVSLDRSRLIGHFAGGDIVILDSFSPHVFMGRNAVADWADGYSHATEHRKVENLAYAIGWPQLFSADNARAFVSMPITWTGKSKGRSFIELGAMATILQCDDACWRILSFSWGSVSYDRS